MSAWGKPLPRWVVLIVGLLLGLAFAAAYVLTNLPPGATEMMRESYARGFHAGRAARQDVSGRSVARTPMSPSPPQAPQAPGRE